MTSARQSLLVRAARGEAVERAPVWAMRQAGRWDPEFHRVRAGLPFYEFAERVDLAAEASLLPRRFGVDAIILFYDITTLAVSMGLPFTLQPGSGPVPDRPLRTADDVRRLAERPDPETFRSVRDLLARVKKEASPLPVIVFAGAPFTVATYCIGTGKDIAATRRFAADNAIVWECLLDRLTSATIHFLSVLIQEGADLYQLFDSWAGLLDPEEYERWAQPQHRLIFAGAAGVPRVLFVKEGPYLDRMAATGAEVISLGKRHDLAAARRDYPDRVFQGNVDEAILRTGTPDDVTRSTQSCLELGGGARHIVNLNHGVHRDTPPANFEAYVRAAQGRVS